jgi:cell division protein FtsW (lipid II flippase)
MYVNGARIWIHVGRFTLQPGEFAKITLALFFASYLASKRDLILLAGKKIGPLQLPRVRDMAPMLVAWLASLAVLVFQSDLGSAILFFGLFMAMIYVATGRVSWIAIGLIFIAVGGALAMLFVSHVQARVNVWLHVFDPEIYNRAFGGSRQIAQGLFALANGGIFGTGIGEGQPNSVSLANSDMIYTALGEELGLVGLAAIVMLYLLLISRGLRAALGARDGFGKLLAAGLSFTLCLQLFVVTAGVLRVMPLTGLTTPFLSAGGSSLLANWVLVALLLLISHNARRPATGGSALSTEDEGAIERRLRVQEASALDAKPEQNLPSRPFTKTTEGGAA